MRYRIRKLIQKEMYDSLKDFRISEILQAAGYYYQIALGSRWRRRKNAEKAIEIYNAAARAYEDTEMGRLFEKRAAETYEVMASISEGEQREYFLDKIPKEGREKNLEGKLD